MLNTLIGPIDFPGAFVAAVFAITTCVVVTTWLARRRSRIEVNNDFALAKLRQKSEDDKAQYSLETERGYKFKQLEQNLITSHKEVKG